MFNRYAAPAKLPIWQMSHSYWSSRGIYNNKRLSTETRHEGTSLTDPKGAGDCRSILMR